MKKFIISVLCAAVFFIGLGSLVEETGARFKSDERALALIEAARTAIGGGEAIKNVKALTIKGAMAKSFDVEGASRTELIELEMNLQLPNQFAKTLKHNREDNLNDGKKVEVRTQRSVVLMNDGSATATFKAVEPNAERQNVFVIKKADGDKTASADIANNAVKKVIINRDLVTGGGMNVQHNELFRTTLALLLTAPQGIDTSFTYIGDADVDGSGCDVVEAVGGSSSVKLYLDKSSHLPRMISYVGFKPMIFKFKKDEMTNEADIKSFTTKLGNPETAEFQVRFSDYRPVNGVLLPHQWTQTIGGAADETINVTGYEINPANIAEKFQNAAPRVLFRMEKKPQQ